MIIRRFEDIEAWQAARELAHAVYLLSTEGTFAKDFALRDQISRSSGSAMDNVAEGFDGGTNAEFCRFLAYSQRSCNEVQSQLYRALDRNHITKKQFADAYELAAKTRAKVGGLINYLRNSNRVREDDVSYSVNAERRTPNEERRTDNR